MVGLVVLQVLVVTLGGRVDVVPQVGWIMGDVELGSQSSRSGGSTVRVKVSLMHQLSRGLEPILQSSWGVKVSVERGGVGLSVCEGGIRGGAVADA